MTLFDPANASETFASVDTGEEAAPVAPEMNGDKLRHLVNRAEIIQGDPNDLVHMEWPFNLGLPETDNT